MGKTRDLIKKIRVTTGIFHKKKVDTIKDRNGTDLSFCLFILFIGFIGKKTEVVCHSPLQWTTFYQTSPP